MNVFLDQVETAPVYFSEVPQEHFRSGYPGMGHEDGPAS